MLAGSAHVPPSAPSPAGAGVRVHLLSGASMRGLRRAAASPARTLPRGPLSRGAGDRARAGARCRPRRPARVRLLRDDGRPPARAVDPAPLACRAARRGHRPGARVGRGSGRHPVRARSRRRGGAPRRPAGQRPGRDPAAAGAPPARARPGGPRRVDGAVAQRPDARRTAPTGGPWTARQPAGATGARPGARGLGIRGRDPDAAVARRRWPARAGAQRRGGATRA